MTLVYRLRTWCWVVVVSLLGGCSLLEVQIDTQTVPLTQQELNMRILTREYAQQFFTQVEQSADSLQSHYPSDDIAHQSSLLLWKIYAQQGLQQSAYQVSPTAGLIDSWVFSVQMAQFFSQGAGQDLFKQSGPRETAEQLALEAETLAGAMLSKEVFNQSRRFVTEFADAHPFNDLTFKRTPAYRAWLTANGISELEATSTLGTMPEALADVSDRLSLASEQTPKIIGWKAELIALNSDLTGEEVTNTLKSVQNTSEALREFIVNNPEVIRELTQQMSEQLTPLIADIDQRLDDKMVLLGEERVAFEAMIARERGEVATLVSQERAKLTQEIDAIAQQLVTLAMDKVIELIKSTILYFVLFLVAVFFAPLMLGYFLGKRKGVAVRSMTKSEKTVG